MIIIAIIASALLVALIAQLTLGNIVSHSEKTPKQIVIEVEEAIEFCAQSLPDELTAKLTYDELRRSLRLHLEWIQAFHWSPENSSPNPLLLDSAEPIEYIQQRCDVTGLDLDETDIKQICESHYEYLIGVGALHTQPKEVSMLDLARPAEIES